VHNQEILSLYEAMVDISQKMLEAARQQQWGDFERLELLCEGYINQIPDNGNQAPLSKEVLARKAGMLKEILSNDRKICELTHPWMIRLDSIMNIQAGVSSFKSDRR
jgi:flagellar protein FliT